MFLHYAALQKTCEIRLLRLRRRLQVHASTGQPQVRFLDPPSPAHPISAQSVQLKKVAGFRARACAVAAVRELYLFANIPYRHQEISGNSGPGSFAASTALRFEPYPRTRRNTRSPQLGSHPDRYLARFQITEAEAKQADSDVALRQKSYLGGGGGYCSRYMPIHLTSQATD